MASPVVTARAPIAYALKLSTENYLASLAQHHRPHATAKLASLVALADGLDAALTSAAEDRRLSPEGRTERRKAATESVRSTLRTFRVAEVDSALLRVKEARARLYTAAGPVTPDTETGLLLRELRAQEVRRELSKLSPEQRLAVYRTGDDVVAFAIESAPAVAGVAAPGAQPRLLPFVDPVQLAEARRERAELRAPAIAAELRQLETLHEVFDRAATAIETGVAAAVPEVREDPPIVTR
jgi:ribosomal protein L18